MSLGFVCSLWDPCRVCALPPRRKAGQAAKYRACGGGRNVRAADHVCEVGLAALK